MRFSNDKVTHLAHLITEGLKKDGLLPASRDGEARKEVKAALIEYFTIDDEIDTIVRRKILSLQKSPPEGSSEWHVLYKKYFREEETRRGR